MKKTLSVLLAGTMLATMSLPTQAAQQYPTFDAAKAQVTDDGYILFIYPEGWDKYGEKLCKKLVADNGVKAAAGSAALILAPIYQKRTEATNAEARKIMGNLGYPGDMSDISYPALLFYDKNVRQYATLYGEELMTASVPEVAALIAARMEAKKKQQALLDQSGKTDDTGKKVKLILQAARVEGVSWPNNVKDTIKSLDPEDKFGCRAALDFGFGMQNGESMDDFLKRLDGVVKNELLSPWQRQVACAKAIGHIRRTLGMMAGGPLITKYAKIMRKLDPKSALGVSAPVVMRDWVKEYRYGQGWSDQIIPSAPVPMLMHDVPITKPGTYVVNFKLTTGRDGIIINRLRLMDGDKCVASHDEKCEVSWSAGTNKNITFTVKKALKNPALEFTFGNSPDKRGTWGEIKVTPQ
ncbi:MAG: hypothetical protein IKZ10_03870 [Akkermansia sp.]|nr:hypothetical protein [Akkermansia sp.]